MVTELVNCEQLYTQDSSCVRRVGDSPPFKIQAKMRTKAGKAGKAASLGPGGGVWLQKRGT